MCKSLSGSIHFEGMKGHGKNLRFVNVKRSGEAIGEDAASDAVKTPYCPCQDYGVTPKDSGRCRSGAGLSL